MHYFFRLIFFITRAIGPKKVESIKHKSMQSWAPVSKIALTRHCVMEAKAKIN